MRLALGLWLFTAGMALADPPPPVIGPAISELAAGVLCSPKVLEHSEAPETKLGYTNVVAGQPKLRFVQQVVPAALGVSFGVLFTPKAALRGVRNLTYRPDVAEPDVYYGDIDATPGRYRGFGFEFASEMVPGLWRMESWQGDQLLYRVEFEVVPEAVLPEVVAQCQSMS